MVKLKKKHINTAVISLSFSVLLGAFSGYFFTEHSDHSFAISNQDTSLAEQMVYPDLIVKGIIEEELGTFKQNAGIDLPNGPLEFDVTTYKVKVEKIIDGSLESDNLVLYQHGSSKDSNVSKNHVKKGEKVYLMLSERTDGKGYWSYNFDDGIWKIKDSFNGEIVESKSEVKELKAINKKSIKEFEKSIKEAKKEAKELIKLQNKLD